MNDKKNIQQASACGKIILTGEYAVLFGYPGVAVPAPLCLEATYTENATLGDIVLIWDIGAEWKEYAEQIINFCISLGSISPGTITIENHIPLGKGMGSSTALAIAIARCLLGPDCEKEARMIEDAMNPGHSGIDFAVIWHEKPIEFVKGETPKPIDLPSNLLSDALLIDTGEPDQQTPELVQWVTKRKDELEEPLRVIGECSKKLQQSHDISDVFREHNAAQQSLGIVTDKAKELITKIEQEGGVAKVIGAGGRTGGSGMVLAMGIDVQHVIPSEYRSLCV